MGQGLTYSRSFWAVSSLQRASVIVSMICLRWIAVSCGGGSQLRSSTVSARARIPTQLT